MTSAFKFFTLLSCLLLSQIGLSQMTRDNRFLNASTTTIAADAELHSYMTELAQGAVKEHCAACHGDNLLGKVGVPNLTDYDWLWGVDGFEPGVEQVAKITQTILYGVRDVDCAEEVKQYGACPDTRFSQMPAYGEIGFTPQQIEGFTNYVLSLSGGEADLESAASVEGLSVLCAECHGEDGFGYKAFGGPALNDDIWLFGGDKEQIYDVIFNGRTEACPAWSNVLEPVTIKALAVYLYNKSQGL